MLTGNQLIKTIKENTDLNKSDIVKICGYSSVRKDGSIKFIASVVCSEDGLIRDSLNYNGVRVLTYSSILKYNQIPLTDILTEFMELGKLSLGCSVEIEYAINIYNDDRKPEFCLLQIIRILQ